MRNLLRRIAPALILFATPAVVLAAGKVVELACSCAGCPGCPICCH